MAAYNKAPRRYARIGGSYLTSFRKAEKLPRLAQCGDDVVSLKWKIVENTKDIKNEQDGWMKLYAVYKI